MIPVENIASQGTSMDEVERIVFASPVEIGILDLESDVGRNPGWLDRGDVGAGYFSAGV